MMATTTLNLDASSLTAFTATLASLPVDEMRKAKSLFIRNSIADYQMTLRSTRGFLIVMGLLSIIPIFLIVFIPSFLGYRAAKENGRRKILNALEVWRSELGGEYDLLLVELSRLA